VRPRARARQRVPVPRRLRRRPCLPPQPHRQRLPRDDRPRPLQLDRPRDRRRGEAGGGQYPARVRCGLVCALAVLTIAVPGPAAVAAPPDDTVPLAVTLSAPAQVRYGGRAVFTGSAAGTLP